MKYFAQRVNDIYWDLTGPLCTAEIVPPKNTVGLIALVKEPYGRCTNTHQIHGFTECIGKCDSRTVYNSSKLLFFKFFIIILAYCQ